VVAATKSKTSEEA
jgi:hypothetical protein